MNPKPLPKPLLVVALRREDLRCLLDNREFCLEFDEDTFGPEVPVHVVICSEETSEDWMDRLEVTHYSNGEARRRRDR